MKSLKDWTRFVLILGLMGLVGCTPAGVKIYKNKYGQYYDYGGFDMPEKPKVNPNKATLQTYLDKHIGEHKNRLAYAVMPSDQHYVFEKDLRDAPYIEKQLEKTALLSYLLYEDGKIVIDELTPDSRFGSQVNDSTPLISNSLGKNMTSYALGHAICLGLIDSVEARLDDWPLVENTLYENQKLIDLINMRAGDQRYVYSGNFLNPRQNLMATHIHQWMRYGFQDSVAERPYYNYNNFVPNLITNYISFKAGENYQDFMTNFLQSKVGIEYPVYFKTVDGGFSFIGNSRAGLKANNSGEKLGIYRADFNASRYDYLRIARAMLEDWQNDTCEGRYLKEIYAKRQRKDRPDPKFQRDLREHNWHNHSYTSYGGFFHTDLYSAPNRQIMAMDGYGGQMIVIDFDEGRIVVTNAVHKNYNWKKIVRGVIKDGKL